MIIFTSTACIGGIQKEIHEAAAQGDLAKVKTILEKKPKSISAKGKDTWTPLHFAAAGGHTEVAELLIAKGADVNMRTITSWKKGPNKMVRKIGPVKIKTPLPQKPSIDRQKHTWAPLHCAAANGHTQIVKLLLDKGAQVDVRDIIQSTPLMVSAWYGHQDVAEALLENGANIIATTEANESVLHAAVISGQAEFCRFLIEKGASITARTKKEGFTPLILAAAYGRIDIIEILIAEGANVNKEDNSGGTALHVAARSGRKDICEILLANKAEVNARSKKEKTTPLHWAAGMGHTETVELLISANAQVDAQTRLGSCPLHWAARAGKKEVVELLINKGANVNLRDSENRTPLKVAIQQKKDAVADLLRRHGGVE